MSTIKRNDIKIDRRKYAVNVEFYNSAMEVARDCKARRLTDSRFHDYIRDGLHNGADWHGVSTYDEALDLLKGGYQPVVESLSEALKASAMGIEKRIKFENDVHGFAPIVPLALKGVPNNMVNMTMKPIKCKVLNVYYDMTVNCSVSSETIISNGKKMLQAIIALEKQGYRFNLYAVQTYSDNDSVDMLCVKVKSSDKPLDLKRISFPLTHTAFFRVVGFDWYSKCPVAKYRPGYGHALSHELGANERKAFAEQVLGNGAIYIGCADVTNKDVNRLKEVFANDSKQN